MSDVTGSPVALRALQTTVDKVWRKIGDMQGKYDDLLGGMRDSIEGLKREKALSGIYGE